MSLAKIPSKRAVNVGGFLVCSLMIGYALYAQHQMMLEPCPLCVLQRFAVIGIGAVFLIAGIHNATTAWRFVYAGLTTIIAAFGIAVAGRHVWLQLLPEDQVPECGPGLDYMWANFPLAEVLDMVFKGSGECAEVDWQFIGLSMPAWVLIAVVCLGGIGIWNNLRQ